MTTKQVATAEVKALDSEDPAGSFEVILSALSVDRDNEQFAAKAFDPLPAHINFDINHSMQAEDIVGSGAPFYGDDGNLHVKGTWARTAKAQEIRSLVADGHLRTTSVTFRAAEKSKSAGPTTIAKAELLNGSFVVVPSNRDALVLSAKAGARHSKADMEQIQSVHDAACALGAACGAKDAEPADEPDPESDTKSATPDQDATGAGDDELDALRLDLDLLRLRAGLDA